MSKVASVLNDLKAEVLLEGSYILTQIADLRARLTVPSEGKQLNFDDYFFYIQRLIDDIPRIELLNRIPKMNEANYTIELIESLDIVQEKILEAQNKAITFQTHLAEVETAIQEVSGTFEAWYLLALAERLDQLELSLPVATRKGLAASEFNRLMGGTRVAVLTLQTALKAERERLDAKKKMAIKKFELGREQVNASWANRLPEFMGVSSQPSALGLLKDDTPEEEESEVTFISKRKPLSEPPIPHFKETATGKKPIVASVESEGFKGDPDAVIEAAKKPVDKPTLGPAKKLDFKSRAEDTNEVDADPPLPTVTVLETREELKEALVESLESPSIPLTEKAVAEIRELALGPKPHAKATPAKTQALVHSEVLPNGFYKTSTPVPAMEITPAKALETFNDVVDDGVIEADVIAESAEEEESQIHEEEAALEKNKQPVLATSARTAVVVMSEDELDDLLPATEISPPTPEPVKEVVRETPASEVTPKKRKPLVFNYSDDDL